MKHNAHITLMRLTIEREHAESELRVWRGLTLMLLAILIVTLAVFDPEGLMCIACVTVALIVIYGCLAWLDNRGDEEMGVGDTQGRDE